VALNRRLAHEMARAGAGAWEVTVAAPKFFHGDLRPILLEASPGEACRLEPVRAILSRWPHFFFYGLRLRRLLSQPFDLVHCWQEPYVFAGGQVALWTGTNKPLVFYTFQNIHKTYPPPFSQIERFCVRRCAGWLPCGELVRETLLNRKCGYEAKPHRVMPLGVDTEHFRPDPAAAREIRASLGFLESGPPVIGFLGRFIEAKGLRILMRALDRHGRSPWRAIFVGGGPMETELREWERRHGERVRIVTGVAHDQVPAYLNAMDILCAPSRTTTRWREQFGRMLVEALACGTPVVASDSGEIPHVVADAGVIVGERDEDGWTNAIGDLLDNAARRKELASRGIQHARQHYAWPVVARMHLEFFDEILASRAGTRG
jgi:glycosyltransferase involved in cell wall biosynthesis